VVSPTYYATDGDFIRFEDPSDVESLPSRCTSWQGKCDLPNRQRNILSSLLQGSFEGDFFSFRGFRREHGSPGALKLAKNLGQQLLRVIRQGIG
jgi:hypothetical protein